VTVAFIDSCRFRWPVRALCQSLGFSERTYYATKRRPLSARSRKDEIDSVRIRRVWENNYRVYGAERVWHQLRREGYGVARCTVERLMKRMEIRGVRRGKRVFTTIPAELASRPGDLVNRFFCATRPHQLWVADLTYVRSQEGWLYVSFVSDVYSRRIVGWQISSRLWAELVADALEMAIGARQDTGELICHSDRGNQYTSLRYTERLAEAGIRPSMGSVGDSYDNAMAESLIGSFKAELVNQQGPWTTRRKLEEAIIGWIQWFNHTRLHSEIGYIPPAEKEADWYHRKGAA
jgi:putative transposase